jgi:hypothetical protein
MIHTKTITEFAPESTISKELKSIWQKITETTQALV